MNREIRLAFAFDYCRSVDNPQQERVLRRYGLDLGGISEEDRESKLRGMGCFWFQDRKKPRLIFGRFLQQTPTLNKSQFRSV